MQLQTGTSWVDEDFDDVTVADLAGLDVAAYAEDEREAEECAARWYAATHA